MRFKKNPIFKQVLGFFIQELFAYTLLTFNNKQFSLF